MEVLAKGIEAFEKLPHILQLGMIVLGIFHGPTLVKAGQRAWRYRNGNGGTRPSNSVGAAIEEHVAPELANIGEALGKLDGTLNEQREATTELKEVAVDLSSQVKRQGDIQIAQTRAINSMIRVVERTADRMELKYDVIRPVPEELGGGDGDG